MAHGDRDRSRSPIRRDKTQRNAVDEDLKNEDMNRHLYKTQIPCSIIIFKNVPQHIAESDIRSATLAAGVAAKDVRFVRKGGAFSSWGSVYVQFFSKEDSQRLMETLDGEIVINDYKIVMQYCVGSDWYCKCGAKNFKHREFCYKCSNTEISSHPTTIVIVIGLTYDITEAHLLEMVNKNCDLSIKCLRRFKDGSCYIETNHIVDSIQLHGTLSSHNLKVGFYRPKSMPSASAAVATSAVAAAQWKNTLADVPRLAEYSANLYAKTPEEKKTYLTYYTQYYAKQISEGGSVDVVEETPDGFGSKSYPAPDVSSFQYDSTSGYYYDSSTKLYYDANTQYFFNSITNKYLYWDTTKNTYFNVETSTKTTEQPSKPQSEEFKDESKKPEDKVKVAKRIAKDMEKWAKQLNQKKEKDLNRTINSAQETVSSNQSTAGSADICFAVLDNKVEKEKDSLVAAYDSDEDNEETVAGEEKLQVDWDKLTCLICKRQFNNKDVLLKHTQLSELHKTNLKMWYTSRNLDPNDAIHRAVQYRDRAKERRQKYGEPEQPPECKLKTKYSKLKEASVAYEEPTKKGIGSDNVGNKLLQKMGWTVGQGLGKTNQGRTEIIEAEARLSSAGLGTNSVGMTPGPGESYKDCVKKMMRARYNQS